MPGDVNALTLLEIFGAMQQCFVSGEFLQKNRHLSQQELQGLRSDPIQWPLKPVFSPYATTHDHYSQIRVGHAKYLMHRVALRSFLQRPIVKECSHTLHLGNVTGR